MKLRIKLCLVIALLCTIFACKKEDSAPAGCDVNGVWVGNWEAPSSSESGSFFSNVTQSSNYFEGGVTIWMDSYTNGNYHATFDGSVKNKDIRIQTYISNVQINVEGDIENDRSVTGTFNVPQINMSGTFEGEKINSQTAQVNEVYKFSSVNPGESILDFMCINNRLWILMYPYEYVDDVAKYKTIITDLDGNQVDEKYLLHGGAFDGSSIWYIYNGNTLIEHDTLGNELSSREFDFNTFQLACNSENFYFTNGYLSLVEMNHSLEAQDTIGVKYCGVYNITCYKDHFLCSSSNVICEVSSTGEIIKAYMLPDDMYISKIVTNDDKIWILQNNYSPDNSEFVIYEVVTN